MIEVSVQSNIAAAIKGLNLADKQVRFAAAVAITRTLNDIKRAEVLEMARTYDRPTPYTLNSVSIKPAKRDGLRGEVWINDRRTGRDTPAGKYLPPSIQGGNRGLKRFELALQNAGVMPRGTYAVPADGARLDAFGNMSRGQIVQLLSYFAAFTNKGRRSNMTDASRARLKRGTKKSPIGISYFPLLEQRGKLEPGIYQSLRSSFGYAVRPVLLYVSDAPTYKRQFDWYGVAGKVAAAEFGLHFQRAYSQALTTAR